MRPSEFISPLSVAARNPEDEFRDRTLRYVEGDLAKLVYLSSCRDCNSGRYRHDGLSSRFSEVDVDRALALCHRELFDEAVRKPLAAWVAELREYFAVADGASLVFWRALKPYQIAVPMGVAPLAVALFTSNLGIAVEILRREPLRDSPDGPAGTP